MAESNASGECSFAYLLPGTYTVTVEATGFGKAIREGATSGVSQKLSLNFRLDLGATTQTLTVQADTAMINTADASGGTVMSPNKVQNRPLHGCQVSDELGTTFGRSSYLRLQAEVGG